MKSKFYKIFNSVANVQAITRFSQSVRFKIKAPLANYYKIIFSTSRYIINLKFKPVSVKITYDRKGL